VRFLVIGNPANRRLRSFAAAAEGEGHTSELVPWLEVLASDAWVARAEGALVKFDSPGEDFEVERGLLELGASVEEEEHPQALALSRAQAQGLSFDRGLIRAPRQWYRGFAALLGRCEELLSHASPRLLLNRPREIALMFDKARTHAALTRSGVALPPATRPVSSYTELREELARLGWSRVFLKLNSGSSASGVVALQVNSKRVLAQTSAELVEEGGAALLYNSLRIRRYQDEAQVARVVDLLAAEGVHVERWIPKASLAGEACDLRVVVIGGRARQAVVRQGRSPMTNLHLGNRRGDLAAYRHRLGEDGWRELGALAESACAPFDALYAGVDVLVDSRWSRQAVLELNAFGDLIPGVEHEGEGCYLAQIREAVRRAT
jgi:glutathione synthase/RimK-type ligase-like ATP-grasp enzyme